MCGKYLSRSQLCPSGPGDITGITTQLSQTMTMPAARQVAESYNTAQLRMIVCTDQLVYVLGYG